VGEERDIHPHDKQAVGKRLAQWALAKTYGKDVLACGPLYKSMHVEGGTIVLEFDYAEGGLAARDGDKLKGFAIAGPDKIFVWADARIVGNTVVVSSPKVSAPAAVRYAWANNPDCNLINKAGLPASPFRTDDWK
jgi:sialate O-acetylesterase